MTNWVATEQRSATGQKSAIPQTSLYATNVWWLMGGFCFIYLFFNWYLQTSVLTDQVYTYSLGGQVNPDKLSAFLEGQHRMSIFSYILIPVTLLGKMTLVAFCLLVGLLLTSRHLSFRTLLRIVLVAEGAFVAGTLFRLLLLTFSHQVESLGQYISFAPLSLYSLFNPSSVPVWLNYPLQTLDVFQAGYILLLAIGMQHYLRRPFKEMFRLVLATYGVGLLACMIASVFISISFSH